MHKLIWGKIHYMKFQLKISQDHTKEFSFALSS